MQNVRIAPKGLDRVAAGRCATIVGILLVAALTTSCGFFYPGQYRVFGTATSVHLSYTADDGSTVDTPGVSLSPSTVWSYSFTALGNEDVFIRAENEGATGWVTAEIDVLASVEAKSTTTDPYGVALAAWHAPSLLGH